MADINALYNWILANWGNKSTLQTVTTLPDSGIPKTIYFLKGRNVFYYCFDNDGLPTYVKISEPEDLSKFTTDDLTEGLVNKYFPEDARVKVNAVPENTEEELATIHSELLNRYTKEEIANLISEIYQNIDYKEAVDNYSELLEAYPTPEESWVVQVNDEDTTYRYDGVSWINIGSITSMPLATHEIDGKMSKEDKIKMDGLPSVITAQVTKYTPADIAKWKNNIPTNVKSALDELVDRAAADSGFVRFEVLNMDLLSLNISPKELIAAPPEGYVTKVSEMFVMFRTGTVPFNSTQLTIGFASGTLMFLDELDQLADQTAIALPGIGESALILEVPTGETDLVDGDGSLDVYVKFNYINLETGDVIDSVEAPNISTDGMLQITVEQYGNPVPGMSASIKDSLAQEVYTGISDSNGRISVLLPEGIYSVDFDVPIGMGITDYTLLDPNNTNNVSAANSVSGIDITSGHTSLLTMQTYNESVPTLSTILINNGDSSAAYPVLDVRMFPLGVVTEYMIATTPEFYGASWVGYTTDLVQFTHNYISEVGITLYVKVRNLDGESNVVSDSISLINPFVRSDSALKYNTLNEALEGVYLDYGKNLPVDVTISVSAATKNIRKTIPYATEIVDLNLTSNKILTIDGGNLFTLECDSLAGIKIKNSRNIIIKRVHFTQVGAESTHMAPEELAGVFAQGTSASQSDNIVVRDCTFDGEHNGLKGSFGIIMKYVVNATILNCNLSNFDAVPVLAKNIGSFNFIKNNVSGTQTIGIVSQPTLISATAIEYANITDNILNGGVDPTRRFDTGLIIESARVNLERNVIHDLRGEALRCTTVTPGEYINIVSNVFYNNLLQQPYVWVKSSILILSDYKKLNVINNSIRMSGINLNQFFEVFLRVYVATIDIVRIYNNVVKLEYNTPFVDNYSSAKVFYFDYLIAVESGNNYYIDRTLDGGISMSNFILDTGPDSVLSMNNMKDLSVLQASGYEINSKIIDYQGSTFSSLLNLLVEAAEAMPSDLAEMPSSDVLYRSNGLNNAGAYNNNGTAIDESIDISTYDIESIVTGERFSNADIVTFHSTDKFIITQQNPNRSLVSEIRMLSEGYDLFFMGRVCIATVLSKLNVDGLYAGDSIYDVQNNTSVYLGQIIATQRRTVANFIASNYFPEVGDTVNLTNTSIESDNNLWHLDDGSTPATIDANISVIGTDDLSETLDTSNTSTSDSVTKKIYPMGVPILEYFDITVSSEVARVGDSVNISLLPLNIPAGDPVYSISVLKHQDGTQETSAAADTLNYTFIETGIYDVEGSITINGDTITQKKTLLITVTPALEDINTAFHYTVPAIADSTFIDFTSYAASEVVPGKTVVLHFDDGGLDEPEHRLSISGFHGTAENPIVFTIDESTQKSIYFNSYWGILIYDCSYVVFDGRGYQNLDQGLHITKYPWRDTAEVGISIGHLSTNVEVFGVEISHVTFAGLQAKTDPKPSNPEYWRANFVMEDFLLHHMIFRDTDSEGIYVGYFNTGLLSGTNADGEYVEYYAHMLNNCKIYHNDFIRNGWDALQANNLSGYSEIAHNNIIDAAVYPETDQATMMSISLSGALHHNRCIGSGGVGIQFMPLGTLDIYNNVIDKVAYGYSAWLLLNESSTPALALNPTVNMFNNTAFCTGTWMSARNVVQIPNIFIKNNVISYKSEKYAGQDAATIDAWVAQEYANYRVLDDGSTFQIADIENSNYNISVKSVLATSGAVGPYMYDMRGYLHWYAGNKFVGAYAGYRKQDADIVVLSSITINNGATSTGSSILSISAEYIGNGAEYMVSTDPLFADGVWEAFVNPFSFTLPDASGGTKTVYVKLKTSTGVESDVASSAIDFVSLSTFLIDFGRNVATYPSPAPWNNITATSGYPVPVGEETGYLTDTSGAVSTYNCKVTGEFSDNNYQGGTGTEATSIERYPWTAVRDQFYSDGGGQLTIEGLDDGRLYTVKCFGSRAWVTSYDTIFTVNGVSIPITTKNNVATTADFTNVSPVGGKITIDVDPQDGATAGTINLIEFLEQ